MEKDNSKVPVAILSCFLIAFILQGILKMCGIFVFEKALNWEIFNIIDSCFWTQVVFYSFIVFIVVYCLSFTMTSRAYTDKWYHYLIIVIPVNIITYIRWVTILILNTITVPASTHFLIQFEVYIGIICCMLSMNMLIKYIKRRLNMIRPVDIASDEAKEKELEEIEAKKSEKKEEK